MNLRLEFNEKQQQFHLDNGSHTENTNGWFTVLDSCSDQMYWEFICMLEALHEVPYTRKKIFDAMTKLHNFQALLNANRLVIVLAEKIL